MAYYQLNLIDVSTFVDQTNNFRSFIFKFCYVFMYLIVFACSVFIGFFVNIIFRITILHLKRPGVKASPIISRHSVKRVKSAKRDKLLLIINYGH
jgi:hypothetical protein